MGGFWHWRRHGGARTMLEHGWGGEMTVLRGREVGKRARMGHSRWHRYAMRVVEEMEDL